MLIARVNFNWNSKVVVFTKLENQFTRICFHYLIGDSRESELVKALVKRNSRGDARNGYIIFCKIRFRIIYDRCLLLTISDVFFLLRNFLKNF